MQTQYPSAGVMRRFAAFSYDALLVLALFVIPALAVIWYRDGSTVPPGDGLLQFLLLLTSVLFFAGFWAIGGQTLGMRAWRMRLETTDGEPVNWRQALLRILAAVPSIALLGLGIFWLWLDRSGQTLPDRIAGTRVVVLPKKQK